MRTIGLVPRFDGFVHAVDGDTGKRRWSIYLGDPDEAGRVVSDREAVPGEDEPAEWTNNRSAPLNAPVGVHGDRLYVVAADGHAYCVEVG